MLARSAGSAHRPAASAASRQRYYRTCLVCHFSCDFCVVFNILCLLLSKFKYSMAAMESNRDIIQGIADTHAASTSHVLSEGKCDAVVPHLKHPYQNLRLTPLETLDQEQEVQLMDLPGLGLNQVLVIPNNSKNKVFVYAFNRPCDNIR